MSSSVPDKLREIVAYKREFVARSMQQVPLEQLKALIKDSSRPPDFAAAIKREAGKDLNVIAEVKKASPSKGVIRENFEPVGIAVDYAQHGAAAISVLTDEEYFQGKLDYLRAVRQEVNIVPLLRKDFTIHEYQVYEAREAGAAAVLLIASILDKHQLVGFRQLAMELGMTALTEVHLEREADMAAESGARIIGVNNRDLRTFTVDLTQTEKIIRLLGGSQDQFTFVAESGISTRDDVDYLREVKVDAMLIGEAFMRAESPGKALAQLIGSDEEHD